MLRHFFNLLSGELFAKAFGFVTLAIVARSLTVAGYGSYAYVLAIMMMASSFIFGSLDTYASGAVAHAAQSEQATLLATFFHYRLAWVAGLTALTLTYFATREPQNFHLALLLSAVILNNGINFAFAAKARLETRALSASNVLRQAGFLAILLLFYAPQSLRQEREYGSVAIVAAANIISLTTSNLFLVRRLGISSAMAVRHVRRIALTKIFRESWPLTLATCVTATYGYFGNVVVGQTKGTVAVGYYSAVTTLFSLMQMVTAQLHAIYYPRLASECSIVPTSTDHQFGRAVVSVSVATGLAVIAFADVLLSLVYSSKYLPAAPLLRLFGVNVILSGINGYFAYKLLALKRNGVFSGIMIAITGINAALTLILVPNLGNKGAALAMMIAESVVLVVMSAYFWRARITYFPCVERFNLIAIGAAATTGALLLGTTSVTVRAAIYIAFVSPLAFAFWRSHKNPVPISAGGLA